VKYVHVCEYKIGKHAVIAPIEAQLHNQEQRAEAAAQAREKVLEQLSDLNRYACQEYDEASCSDNEREMRIHLEYGNRTWGIIRSLRTGGGEPR
jgi:hypothetical protein